MNSGGISVMTESRPNRNGVIRATLVVFVAVLVSGVVFRSAATAETAERPPVLVELFTSQGCSSCPPADALLAKLAGRDDIIAVTLAVDYWDYLGWRDTFGQKVFTDRQYAYAKRIGNGMVYTPQVVIDGRLEMIGSDKARIERAIRERMEQHHHAPSLTITSVGDQLSVAIGDAVADPDDNETQQSATVWLGLVSKKEEVNVRNGENRGRKLVYRNVMRELTPIGHWSGKAMTMQLPRQPIERRGADGCVVFLQQGEGGSIVAVANMSAW